MEDIKQKGTATLIDIHLTDTLLEPPERSVAGDAMLGWFTDEEFDVLADSIVDHFDALTGDMQAEGEKDEDGAIGEVLEWLVKEGVKLMPHSALLYLRSLVDEQIRKNALVKGGCAGEGTTAQGRNVVLYDVY